MTENSKNFIDEKELDIIDESDVRFGNDVKEIGKKSVLDFKKFKEHNKKENKLIKRKQMKYKIKNFFRNFFSIKFIQIFFKIFDILLNYWFIGFMILLTIFATDILMGDGDPYTLIAIAILLYVTSKISEKIT